MPKPARTVAVLFLLPLLLILAPAIAWGQPASTWKGTTSDYNDNSNWQGPAPVLAATAAGRGAIFSNLGVTSIAVTGSIRPDSWTFDSQSQSYRLSGGPVNFSTAAGLVDSAGGQTISVSNNMGGVGGVAVRSATGILTLSGNNSYSGATVIDAGATLRAGSNTAFSPNSSFIINGILDLGNFSNRISALSGNGTITTSGGIGILSFAPAGTITFAGSITNGAGTTVPRFDGSGTVILTGSNSFSGTVNLNSGTLQIGNGGTTGTLGTGTVATNGGTLVFNRGDTIIVPNLVSGASGVTQAGAGTTILTRNNNYGATLISAGILQIGNGGATGSLGNGAVTDNAALVFNRSNTITVANIISGTGTLTQAGTGTVILTGANTYGGVTTISAGILQIGNGGAVGSLGAGNVTDNAALVFNRSDTVSVPNVIFGTGSLTQTGSGTLILTGANGYGATIINSGILQVGAGSANGSLGDGDVADNGSLVFNRSDAVTVSNAISGSGSLVQDGSGNLSLTGINSYTGPTIINSGTLSVNGAIAASSVTVNSGGRLSGTGTTGPVTVNDGGTIAPGNSIGTLTVASLTLTPGSTTSMEISPATTDRLNVTGVATLNGTLQLTHAGGVYDTTSYRLIQAGHVISTFTNVTGTLPGFVNILKYSATEVDYIIQGASTIEPPTEPPGSTEPPGAIEPPGLTEPPGVTGPPGTTNPPAIEPPDAPEPSIETEYDFASYGSTPNQIAAGNALSVGSLSGALYNSMGALVESDTNGEAQTLGELAGDIRPSLRAAAIEDSGLIRNALLDHMHRRGEGIKAWGAGLAGYGGIASDGNAEGLHHDSAGFLAGADFDVMPDLRLGLAAGYTSNQAHTTRRLSAATGDAGHVAAYADWRVGDFRVDAGGEYGFGTVRITRIISLLGFRNDGAQDQETGQIFADAAYRLPVEDVVLEPHATMAHAIASSGAFAESGDVSALSGTDASDSQTYAILGLRGAIPGLRLDDMDLTPRLDVGWQHALTQFAPGQTVTLTDASQSFLVLGTPLARDAANLQAGFDLSLDAATLFVAYDGAFAATHESHAFRGGLNWRF